MANKSHKQTAGYMAVLVSCLALGMAAAWTPLAERIDHYAYDEITSRSPAPPGDLHSVVAGIDERTLEARGGPRSLRPILTQALLDIAAAKPAVVAIDVLLHDPGDPGEDQRLEAALSATPNLVLACDLVAGRWENPLERFKGRAAALGHVAIGQDELDGVSRGIPLEQTAGGDRRWALSLEAFRLMRGQPIIESPNDVEVGGTVIPAPRGSGGRAMFVRYRQSGIPKVSVLDAAAHPEMFRGKVVFLGVTALSLARDRVVSPYGEYVAGVEANAQSFETMAQGRFLSPARDGSVLLVCAGFTIAAGLAFAFVPGWTAYALAAALLAGAHYLPVRLFSLGIVFPYFAPVASAWLAAAGAASYQHFFVRRQLRRSESERSRYQQAIHWAAHEMRTPLTAIQGSSEIMARYKLPEEKRQHLSEMINSESKRLSRIIQTFLDVERLADGQMELKREAFSAAAMVETCLSRVRPIAEGKRIALTIEGDIGSGDLVGDRELMEYAFYNLLTNAVKYSPPETRVRVFSEIRGGELRLAVEDQGIGMDRQELASIFKKFYRTKRAEASGEAGTGIGLSIVEQIVTRHGGRIDVVSEPGRGSCFTMVLKEFSNFPANAEAADRRG